MRAATFEEALLSCFVERSHKVLFLHSLILALPWHYAGAFARFSYHPGAVMSQYVTEISRRVDQLDGQALTNLLWSLAVLKSTHCPAFVELLSRFQEVSL